MLLLLESLCEWLDGASLVALYCARIKAWTPAIEAAGRNLAARGFLSGYSEVDLTLLQARWTWILLARDKGLRFVGLDGEAGCVAYDSLPDGALVWFDVLVSGRRAASGLLRRRHGNRRVVRDPDGVLDDCIIDDDETFVGRLEAVELLAAKNERMVVQIKVIATSTCPPLVLYEWQCPTVTRQITEACELGIDVRTSAEAPLAEFWVRLRQMCHSHADLRLRLSIPRRVWSKIRWPSLDHHLFAIDSQDLEAVILECLGDTRVKFTVGEQRFRASLRTVLDVAQDVTHDGHDLLSMLEVFAPPHDIIHALQAKLVDLVPSLHSLKILPHSHRPAPVCVVVGSNRAASAKHADPFAWHGWHLLLRGSKRWRFGPKASEQGASFDDTVVRVPTTTEDAPLGASFLSADKSDAGLSEQVQQPAGTLLVFPADRWHRVTHIAGPTLAICGQFATSPDPVLAHIAQYRKLDRVRATFLALGGIPPWLLVRLFLRLARLQCKVPEPTSATWRNGPFYMPEL